jgi:HAD superfamily hydrolase (TIGR01549 family)
MPLPLKAVLFDLDGVLVHSPLDLSAIKQELFGDPGIFIIEGLQSLPEKEREKKNALLLERELEAAESARLAPGVVEIFDWMDAHGLKRAVITRNSRRTVELIVENLRVDFGVAIGREDAPPKPDPACVLAACERLGVAPEECAMVGDFAFDIQAGKMAGCRTVFLETDKFRHLETGADARIKTLSELVELLETWLADSRPG